MSRITDLEAELSASQAREEELRAEVEQVKEVTASIQRMVTDGQERGAEVGTLAWVASKLEAALDAPSIAEPPTFHDTLAGGDASTAEPERP